MQALQDYIIDKVVVDANTHNLLIANQLKDNVGTFVAEKVMPKIECQLRSLESKNPLKVIRIPKLTLEIDISCNDNKLQLQENSMSQIVDKIENVMSFSKNEEDSTVVLNEPDSKLSSFFHFLEKGTKPWWQGSGEKFVIDLKTVIEISESDGFKEQFKQKLKKSSVRARLINQFSDEDIHAILLHTFKDKKEAVSILENYSQQEIKRLNGPVKKQIWSGLIEYFLTGDGERLKKEVKRNRSDAENAKIALSAGQNQQLQAAMAKILKKIDLTPNHLDLDSKIDSKLLLVDELNSQEDENDLYVENAGLILLHPFLSYFFKDCGLLNDQDKIADPEMAIHLLHYVATKEEGQYEDCLVFEKFLCGIPIQQSINRNVRISKEMKAKVGELLGAVIKNWETLKNSSPDLLRNEFLQRPGKLNLKGKNPKLVVERKTQDILLGKLTWNISIFKLPWMDKLIFIDW